MIHVGLGHSGTTSLQENIFSRRPDLHYAGIPYGDLGGIFSWIKYCEEEQYDHERVAGLCEELIFSRIKPKLRLILSDENFVEQPAIYYTPAMMPVRIIAMRLRSLFGRCAILFTIRNQFDYVISNYLVLKRNAVSLEGIEIEPFEHWFRGNFSQERNLFLRNLDASYAIRIYGKVFGADAIHVLPLELLTRDGLEPYLRRLGGILGVGLSHENGDAYPARNVSPAHNIVLTAEQRTLIHERAAKGNTFIAREYGLPLAEYGYPMEKIEVGSEASDGNACAVQT